MHIRFHSCDNVYAYSYFNILHENGSIITFVYDKGWQPFQVTFNNWVFKVVKTSNTLFLV